MTDSSAAADRSLSRQDRAGAERTLTAVATDAAASPDADLDRWLNEALGRIGEAAGADRSYLFLYRDSPDGTRLDNTHEWCAVDIEPQIEMLQDLPVEGFEWWIEQMELRRSIAVSTLDQLPPEATGERAILEAQDICSIMVLPVVAHDTVIGFAGFDAVGSRRMWEDWTTAMLDQFVALVGSAMERIRAYRDDDRSRVFAGTLLDAMPEPSAVIRTDGIIEATNTAWQAVSGMLPAVGESVLATLALSERSAPFAPAIGAGLRAVLRGDRERFEMHGSVTLDGNEQWYQLRVFALPEIDAAVLTIANANQSVDWHDPARMSMSPDDMIVTPETLLVTTGSALADAGAVGGRIAVLHADIDDFTSLNVAHGPEFGDMVLMELLRRLDGRTDDSVRTARVRGDEFVAIVRDCVGDDATVLADPRLGVFDDVFAEPIEVDGGPRITLTAAVGVALSDPGSRPDALLRQAEAAARSAKVVGPGARLVFGESMRRVASERRGLVEALRSALSTGDGLALHYQPEVRLADGTFGDVEALLRADLPGFGPVSPMLLVQLAEDHDLIEPLGDWVLRSAARAAAALRDAGHPTTVWVNVSMRQLDDPQRFHRSYVDALDAAGLPTTANWSGDALPLGVELTESAVMGDADVTGALERLASVGIHLAVDDFGTGHSSLAYLHRFPVHTVKIDRSFVSGLGTNPASNVIVSSVVTIAAHMGFRVVAEGVETAEQRDTLRELGCDLAQGYLYARPMPEADLVALLDAGGRPGSD